MTTRALTAGLFAAIAWTTPGPTNAADLYGENYRYEQGDYQEPRYADRYRGEEDDYEEGRYNGYGYEGYRGSTKDGEYLEPMDQRPRFSQSYGYGYEGCTPRWQVKRRLQADGWRNFERLAVRPRVVVIRAERPNGRPFDLKVDRCTGEVVDQRPARFRGYGVYGPGPRRYGYIYR
jgi:hypothetical protein